MAYFSSLKYCPATHGNCIPIELKDGTLHISAQFHSDKFYWLAWVSVQKLVNFIWIINVHSQNEMAMNYQKILLTFGITSLFLISTVALANTPILVAQSGTASGTTSSGTQSSGSGSGSQGSGSSGSGAGK